MSYFRMGFKAVAPLISGILPFGAVVGSAFAEANLSLFQAAVMDTFVYAGAAQLASVDLMKLNAAAFVVVGTGAVINLRFLLYSAAMAPFLKGAPFWTKFATAYTLTDQSYATMIANQDKLPTNQSAVEFYLGTAVCMLLAWHSSVLGGFVFGNFAPPWLSLDFAIPLSFVALLVPTLKTKTHLFVAALSSTLSLGLFNLPLRTGIMATALISITVAWLLLRPRGSRA